jgi:hypothetical protein
MRAEASRYKTFRWISEVDDITDPQTRCGSCGHIVGLDAPRPHVKSCERVESMVV